MKSVKNYYKKREKKGFLFSCALTLCAAVGLYWVLFFSPGSLEKLSSYIVYPLLIFQKNIVKPVHVFFERQKTVEELMQALKISQIECNTLLARSIELESMRLYHEQIKELVEYKQRYEVESAHLAQIILRQFSDQAQFILIDRGLNDGIKTNMVAVYKNCLIGRVAHVYPYYSKVVLLTDSSCKIAAVCSATKAPGILEGRNQKDTCMLNYVSHLCSVEPNDLVLSSGQGLVFPQGFALGKIKDVERQGLFHVISVEPLIDIKQLDYCYIVQKGHGNRMVLKESIPLSIEPMM